MPTPCCRRSASISARIRKRSTCGRKAGADVNRDRVRFPRGLVRSLIGTAPRQFTQFARNPARSVEIGGGNTVFAPVYGPPFIRNLDEGRRYATIEDFRNFVKLAYHVAGAASLGRHGVRAGRHSGGQAPPRHGLQPHPVLRQTVHGLGHCARAGGRTRSAWPRWCSATSSSKTIA